MINPLRSIGNTMKRAIRAVYPELEAGRMARRLSNWQPSRAHVNTLIGASGKTVIARARYLSRNNGYAAGAVDCFASNVIGTGICPSWKVPDVNVKEELQSVWTQWTDECDAEGVTDFYGLQRRIARELFIAGECFVRFRPRFSRDGLKVPIQLELLPAEQLPTERNLWLSNGGRVRQGIEFDQIGRRVAYHFWKVHPGDVTQSNQFGKITIVPASEVLHIYDPIESGQLRGLSRLTPAIVPLWMLDCYDDAEMDRKKVAALFSVFIKRQDPVPTFLDKLAETQAETDGSGVATIDLQPGVAHQLMPGEDVSVAAPAEVGNTYEVFQYRSLLKFCAAVGLPYSSTTADTVRANYSSQRAAMLEMRRRMEALQNHVIVYQLCRPVAQRFMDAAAISGALKLKGYARDASTYQKIDWIAPPWDWIDPLKDLQAEVIAVNAGFKPRSRVVQAEGFDPIENDNQIAEDAERAANLNLVFQGTLSPVKEVAEQPTDEESKPTTQSAFKVPFRSEKQATRPIQLVRHGSTKYNNDDVSVDRIRGWTDVPLSKEGKEEAKKLGEALKNDPPAYLVTSDLKRASETANIISGITGIAISKKSQDFRPWNVGDYAGKTTKESMPDLIDYVCNKPDVKVPGGESFNDFKNRFIGGLNNCFNEYDGKIAIVAHHRNERLLKAWEANNYAADGSIDDDIFGERGEPTGEIADFDVPPESVAAVLTPDKKANGHTSVNSEELMKMALQAALAPKKEKEPSLKKSKTVVTKRDPNTGAVLEFERHEVLISENKTHNVHPNEYDTNGLVVAFKNENVQ